MPNVVEYGYLDLPYLDDDFPYLTGVIGHGVRSQVDRKIPAGHTVKNQVDRNVLNFPHTVGSQVDRKIPNALHVVRTEVKRGKNEHRHCGGYLDEPYLGSGYLEDKICVTVRSQVDRGVSESNHVVMSQVSRTIANFLHPVNSQVQRRIDALHRVKSQVARTIANFLHPVNSQVQRRIDVLHRVNSQVQRRIDALHRVKSQVIRLQAHPVLSQVTQALYNITNLRIMMEFPSRGTSGTNWTSNSTLAGDFSVLNLNTDIVEQVWRSNNTLSGIQLVCDSEVPQGVFADTLVFLNHNLTTSASVVWQQSNDPGFSSTFDTVFSMTTDNFYWISPTLPLTGYRYNRFLISDPTNSNPYLQIGTILFGPTIIFHGECFVDRVQKATRHFSDKVLTEGFTNVSNDRAIKYAVSLEFRSLNYNRGNYRSIRAVFDFARTSLKCLWIPTPQYASRFATFAKLVAIPEESHNVKGQFADYIDFSITTDESY